jgi:hypothetical protein
MNNKVGDFCKRIKSQQSDLTIKIPVFHKIQFSKKDSCNKTMKNEANQWQLFSESQILQQNRPPKKVHTYGSRILFSLQPQLPKIAQDWKFILEMCLKTHLFSNL